MLIASLITSSLRYTGTSDCMLIASLITSSLRYTGTSDCMLIASLITSSLRYTGTSDCMLIASLITSSLRYTGTCTRAARCLLLLLLLLLLLPLLLLLLLLLPLCGRGAHHRQWVDMGETVVDHVTHRIKGRRAWLAYEKAVHLFHTGRPNPLRKIKEKPSSGTQQAISMQSAGPHLEPLLALQPSKARVRGCIQRRIG